MHFEKSLPVIMGVFIMGFASVVATSIFFFPDRAAADESVKETVDSSTLMDQIKLFFQIGETTRELNMEERGISGLNDTAGQSVGEKNLQAMKEKYLRLLQEHPDDAEIWTRLGSVLETLGQESSALAAYRQAITINPENRMAQQGMKRIAAAHRILARVYYSFQHQKEFAPALDRDIATWEEQLTNVQLSKSWGQGKSLGLGWIESTIYQKNELYGDVDFSLKRQAPFLHVSWQMPRNISLAARLRDEKFSNRDASGFYRLDGSEHIFTGYLALAYRSDMFWTNFNYSRERDPDPVYDLTNNRSALNIKTKQLTGFSAGYAMAPSWELGSSLYYEQYGTARENQLNPNIQISHWLSSIPGTRVSLGYGYYTEEYENIFNLTTSYQWKPWAELLLRFEYQFEYSSKEASLLNQGDLLLNWSVTDRLSAVIRVDYSQESGGDEDGNFFAQASLSWSMY